MQEMNKTSLYALLENLPSEQLKEMLDRELHSNTPDDNAVRMILHILRERRKDQPVEITPEISEAWQQYRQDIANLEQERPKRRLLPRLVIMAASFAMVCVMFFTLLPQQAEANDLWLRFANWTDEIFQFSNSSESQPPEEEYVFRTDNPGLQQVYDAVVEMGVTEPVVPMWLPEGYELVECETVSVPSKKYVHARFGDGNIECIYYANVYFTDVPHEYDKDAKQVDVFERNGVTYNIMHNKNVWYAIWSRNNLECSFAMDCQEDTLYRILESIYTMEENS